jgi:hypothetical protein
LPGAVLGDPFHAEVTWEWALDRPWRFGVVGCRLIAGLELWHDTARTWTLIDDAVVVGLVVRERKALVEGRSHPIDRTTLWLMLDQAASLVVRNLLA